MTDLHKIRAAQVHAAEQAAIADLPPELLASVAPTVQAPEGGELPPLPPVTWPRNVGVPSWTAEEVQAYARAAVRAAQRQAERDNSAFERGYQHGRQQERQLQEARAQAPAEGDCRPCGGMGIGPAGDPCGDCAGTGQPQPKGAEPIAYTVAGEVTNWARDFSKYRTQHYTRPVYAHAPALVGEIAEMDDGALVPVWTDGTPAAGTKLYAGPDAAPAPAPEHITVQRLVSVGSPVGAISAGNITTPAPAPEAVPGEKWEADVECITDESGTDYSVSIRGPGLRNPDYSDVWMKKRPAEQLVKWLNKSVLARFNVQGAAVGGEGMALVPITPTKAMVDAGRWSEYGEETSRLHDVDDDCVLAVWGRMLDAASTKPPQAGLNVPVQGSQS